jgi:hypothetical protein
MKIKKNIFFLKKSDILKTKKIFFKKNIIFAFTAHEFFKKNDEKSSKNEKIPLFFTCALVFFSFFLRFLTVFDVF